MVIKRKIHFVCRGNIFQSRLAEAYAKSLILDDWEISSSGIAAKQYAADFISPWAQIGAKQYNLSRWLNSTRTQTTTQILQASDVVVFMSHDVYRDARILYDFNEARCLVWDIKDRGDWRTKLTAAQKRNRTIKLLERRIDRLTMDTRQGGWVDIVDAANKQLGYSLPICIVNQKGLWHRGCHAIISTPDGHTIVQKRSKNIIFSPSLIDVSLGGHVDAGENPSQAMVREIKEEIGLTITHANLEILAVKKWSSYHPRYKLHNKIFTYIYHVTLADNNPTFIIQKEEVAMVKLVSPKQLKHLLNFYKLKRVGQLNYSHAFYLMIAKSAGLLPYKP